MHLNFKVTFKKSCISFMTFFFWTWDLSTLFSIHIFIFALCVHERQVRVGRKEGEELANDFIVQKSRKIPK